MRAFCLSVLFLSLLLVPSDGRQRDLSCYGEKRDFSSVSCVDLRKDQEGAVANRVLDACCQDPIFLIVWASYCAPCVRKIPSVTRLKEALRSKGLKTRVILMSIDPKKENFAQHKLPLSSNRSVLWSSDLLYRMKDVRSCAIPCAFLIRGGKAFFEVVPEGNWDESDIVSKIVSFEGCGS